MEPLGLLTPTRRGPHGGYPGEQALGRLTQHFGARKAQPGFEPRVVFHLGVCAHQVCWKR